jgi:predicted permease
MLLQEIRHSFRMFARNPGFTAIAALSLALGIGANSATFSMADALLLRPLPIQNPRDVLTVSTDIPTEQFAMGGVSYPDYRDLCARTLTFEGLTAYQTSGFSVAKSSNEVPQIRGGIAASDNFFRVLGVQPVLGRGFLPEDGQIAGRSAVVVLSFEYWRTEYAQDPSVIHRVMRINGIEFDIVGIAPESFTGVDQYFRPALFVPSAMLQRLNGTKENPLENRTTFAFDVKGRLKPGVSAAGAQAEFTTLWKNLKRQYPETDGGRIVAVTSELQGRIRQSPPNAQLIATLLALVALVLLIACANVANLLLSRARGRSREIAVRLALGVGRLRLVRQFLVESLLLAIIGGIVGMAFAFVGIRFLQTIPIPTDLPIVISPQLDLRVLTYSLLVSMISAIAFGLAPTLQSLKTDLIPALKDAESGFAGRKRMFGRNTLVVAQVAFAMVLLIATGMLLDGFRHSLLMNPGFRTDHLMIMEFDTTLVRYTSAQNLEFFRTLIDRTRALPGVHSATLMEALPFSNNQATLTVIPEGYRFPPGRNSASEFGAAVDEKFFDVMKTQIVRGRAFTADDKLGSRPVAIVNEKFAQTFWPNQEAIGKRLRLNNEKGPWLEVVGVAKTGKYLFIGEPPQPYVYLSFAQHERQGMILAAESYGDPASLAGPIRDVVHGLDGNMSAFNVRTFEEFYRQRAVALPAMIVEIVGTMCLIGLTLALIGLYGLIAYSVARRTREIGIRMAIGANQSDVLRMVLRQGLVLSISGIAFGGLLSLAVARALAAGLIGIGRPSIATYVLVPVILLLVTLVSCYIPARRASLVDPIRALRNE